MKEKELEQMDKEELLGIIKAQRFEIERLNNIINKAIEYIKNKYDYILGDDTFLDHDEKIDRKQILHLLDILKGE